ncbi:MAG TPA: hypothetical protein VGX25_08655 [Actinophytocola sp.]|uniref:hypothetical protein n=1 Tax=Actinophytocola sp. TaxID=1872138 RepID=UPI002DDD887E|nr:hypothetical protein [Actinophytocola sp.]HEV2779459.1 hypothetical protein [Actinophytocola sp.]
MLFLEAGLREIDDQLAGRSRAWKDELAWARIPRTILVRRARRIAGEELRKRGLRVGEGGFRERWPEMANFLVCLVRYACTAPRWRAILDYGPRRALAALPRVRGGELALADLVTRIAKHDLRLRVRMAKGWLFQLSLAMDAKWKAVANKAYRELLEAYAERWMPVYDEGIRQLGAKLRPGLTSMRLSAMVSAQISGFAEHIAGTGDEAYLHGEDCVALFADSVQLLIYAAIDPGDGKTAAEALSGVLGGDN